MWTNFVSTSKISESTSKVEPTEINLSELTEEIMNAELKQMIDNLNKRVDELTNQLKENQQTKVEEYKDVEVTVNQPSEVSLKIFETLPEFIGEREKYATWRTMVNTAMKLLADHPSSMRYFEALMIIRNKVKGAASNILNNYNTAFNFDAIIDRLDFTYADKRPLYVLEQELTVLQQNKLTMDEFYDKVNEKLNAIVNKINMSYKEKATAIAFVESMNQKALRTFITGLNNKKGELLYASNPSSLPEAYARLQTIINDQERINFANRYNQGEKNNVQSSFQSKNQPSFQSKNPQFRYKTTEQPNLMAKQNDQQPLNAPEPMEIDKSSINVNVERGFNPSRAKFNQSNQNNTRFYSPFKRNHSNNNYSAADQKPKHVRVNNIQQECNYAKTILEDDRPEELVDEEIATVSNCSSTNEESIFLGE